MTVAERSFSPAISHLEEFLRDVRILSEHLLSEAATKERLN